MYTDNQHSPHIKPVYTSAFETDPNATAQSTPGQAPTGQPFTGQPFTGQPFTGQVYVRTDDAPSGPVPVMAYAHTADGQRKIVEMILCLGGFISAMIPSALFTPLGGQAVYVCTAGALVLAILVFSLNTCQAHHRPRRFLLDVYIGYIILTLFLLGCAILTAVRAYQLFAIHVIFVIFNSAYLVESVAACCAFLLAAFLVFAYDAYFYGRLHKEAKAIGLQNAITTQNAATIPA